MIPVLTAFASSGILLVFIIIRQSDQPDSQLPSRWWSPVQRPVSAFMDNDIAVASVRIFNVPVLNEPEFRSRGEFFHESSILET